MTKSTLSPSAKATPKAAPKRATNGTPPTAPNSGSTSATETQWTVFRTDGDVLAVTVLGGNGRVSFGGRANELRIYRNESTPVFDAAFSGVDAVYSGRVTVEKLYNTRGRGGTWSEVVEPTMAKPSFVTAAIPGVKPMWHDLTPQEQSEWEVRAEDIGSLDGKDLYERNEY